MTLIVWLLTAVLVLNCLVLILLVLIQLPKKEAGAGIAFGGAATDALFGAGSGNVLTKVTKYATGLFFALAIVLSLIQSKIYHSPESAFSRSLREQQAKQGAGSQTLPPTTEPAPGATATGTNSASTPAGLSNAMVTPTAVPAPAATTSNSTPTAEAPK